MTRQEMTLFIVTVLILLAFTIGGYIIEYQAEKEEKAERRLSRHCDDTDKQRSTDDMEAVYKEHIINEIWK